MQGGVDRPSVAEFALGGVDCFAASARRPELGGGGRSIVGHDRAAPLRDGAAAALSVCRSPRRREWWACLIQASSVVGEQRQPDWRCSPRVVVAMRQPGEMARSRRDERPCQGTRQRRGNLPAIAQVGAPDRRVLAASTSMTARSPLEPTCCRASRSRGMSGGATELAHRAGMRFGSTSRSTAGTYSAPGRDGPGGPRPAGVHGSGRFVQISTCIGNDRVNDDPSIPCPPLCRGETDGTSVSKRKRVNGRRTISARARERWHRSGSGEDRRRIRWHGRLRQRQYGRCCKQAQDGDRFRRHPADSVGQRAARKAGLA